MRGTISVLYHLSIVGERDKSPTYCKTTNGFGLIVLVAKLFPRSLIFLYGKVIMSPDFWYPAFCLSSLLVNISFNSKQSSLTWDLRMDCCVSIEHL